MYIMTHVQCKSCLLGLGFQCFTQPTLQPIQPPLVGIVSQSTTTKTAYELFDFAGTLAQRLAELVKARKLQPASSLWVVAVDNILIKAVDSQTQTHEEVLRLLLAAAPLLAPAQLGTYLALTLENSKKSRRRVKKHISSNPDFASMVRGLGLIGQDFSRPLYASVIIWTGLLSSSVRVCHYWTGLLSSSVRVCHYWDSLDFSRPLYASVIILHPIYAPQLLCKLFV